MKPDTISQFYKDAADAVNESVELLLPPAINRSTGHFNVFSRAEFIAKYRQGGVSMPYNTRTFYKISLVKGRNRINYADKIIDIENNAIVFGTPKIPYNWISKDNNQHGSFCIFTEDFLMPAKSGIVLDDLPIFRPGGYPVFQLDDKQMLELNLIFERMQIEIASDYTFKYDLIRNYLLEIIHYGQKLQPLTSHAYAGNATSRVSSLFIELLERQFPITSSEQKLILRTPGNFARRLSVHVNYLNKLLKENTGKTTSQLIDNRISQEAQMLLKQTDWDISEITYSLGFEQPSHFSTFIKKQTSKSPKEIRNGHLQ
jgi:AraC-like DNA-binding protein